MTWLHEALVTIFNAAIWEAGHNGRIPLADMPALGQWMAQGWPPVQHDVMDADEFLWFALDAVSQAEQHAGAAMFLGRPDRWYEAGRWRCAAGHVSSGYIKSESLGAMCQCGELARLTFPGDEEMTFDDEWGDA
jgi:hypothetical protein